MQQKAHAFKKDCKVTVSALLQGEPTKQAWWIIIPIFELER